VKLSQRAVVPFLLTLSFYFLGLLPLAAQTNPAPVRVRIVEMQGTVEVFKVGASGWSPALTNQVLVTGDRVRTLANSRVALRWSEQSVIPFGAVTELEILPPREPQSDANVGLIRGVLSFFHREKPGRIHIVTRGTSAGVEGTEFVVAVNDSDRTTISVVDGKVRFGNEQATLVLTNGQQAIADPGQAPVQTAGFIANNVLQWCFYYPAVLDLADLNLSADEQNALADSIAAYRSGDLLNALARYPENRQPGSDAERVYRAALLLSVGQVEQTEAILGNIRSESPQPLAAAIRTLIAAVKRSPQSAIANPQSATELVAQSYHEQSRANRSESLEKARELAREATVKSPQFGFAWTRLAELEFSFGEINQASEALERGLQLSPRNAQALALNGFLLAAENKITEAIASFDSALQIDSALANAWLGRGLCRIRRGDRAGGREDLLIAAALEPQRAELRSYLGKAHQTAGDFDHAEKELKLASRLDPNDPTPYLYSALVHQRNNRVNDAIRDLEKSQSLNDNRSVYRSQLLLNQDHAVRSANLAQIYADAGMTDVGHREATRAVTYDYANYSAHMFLAYSYEAMRDRNNVNLRYQTPTYQEYWLANLLAPVEAGPISPAVSQGEYARLFTQNHFGFVTRTEYLSRGAWSQSFVQYGTFDSFNYSLEGTYLTDPGQYLNNDYELKQLVFSLKQRITSQDHVFLRVEGAKQKTGDVAQRYDPNGVVPSFETEEEQIPNVVLGYHREWSPGIHTLLLLGRLHTDGDISAQNVSGLATLFSEGAISGVRLPFLNLWQISSKRETYSAELQQVFETDRHTAVIGARVQHASYKDKHYARSIDDFFFTDPVAADQNINSHFGQFSVYAYESWQIHESLRLVGGLSYDWIEYPRFMFSTPIWGRQDERNQLSPKAGLIWNATDQTTLRFAYTRSLGGASLDQDLRIEPTQVAGINQSFRTLIPESLLGSIPGARFETYGLMLEQKFETGTYLSLSAEMLNSKFDRWQSAYFLDTDPEFFQAVPNGFGMKHRLDYSERSIVFTADQLIGSEWVVGARYRVTDVDFKQAYPEMFSLTVDDYDIAPRQHLASLLHQLNLHVNFNHSSGFFSSFEAVWYRQEHMENLSSLPGDDFWHFNLVGGYRFWNRRARAEVGVLNLTDQDYRLHPLVWHNELPRERTFVARFQLSF